MNIFNVTVDNDMATTINVYLRGGVQSVGASGGTFIDGYLVKKGSGNSASSIEVGDYIIGWFGNTWAAGIVNNLPLDGIEDITVASSGQPLT